MIGFKRLYSASMRCESNIKRGSAGLRPSPTARFRSLRGLGLRRTVSGISGRSTPATPSPSGLGGGLRFAGRVAPGPVTACRLDSPCRVLPAGHTLAPEVNRPAWIHRGPDQPPDGPKGLHPAYCLSPGRGGARSGGREERGILAYPPARREGGRVGVCDASAEPDRPQRPERPDGSESPSVTGTGNSDEQSVKTVCEERGSAAAGEEETTKPGASVDTG